MKLKWKQSVHTYKFNIQCISRPALSRIVYEGCEIRLVEKFLKAVFVVNIWNQIHFVPIVMYRIISILGIIAKIERGKGDL